MEKLNKPIPDRISDELYDKTIGEMNRRPGDFSLYYKRCIIHAVDSCSRGYMTPLEVYEALEAPYFPEHLTVRPSAYAHLI